MAEPTWNAARELERAEARIEELEREAQAAHDEAPFFCNKCGFYGEATDEIGSHANCNYLAVRAIDGARLYNAIVCSPRGNDAKAPQPEEGA